jgi:hypothetical protein
MHDMLAYQKVRGGTRGFGKRIRNGPSWYLFKTLCKCEPCATCAAVSDWRWWGLCDWALHTGTDDEDGEVVGGSWRVGGFCCSHVCDY